MIGLVLKNAKTLRTETSLNRRLLLSVSLVVLSSLVWGGISRISSLHQLAIEIASRIQSLTGLSAVQLDQRLRIFVDREEGDQPQFEDFGSGSLSRWETLIRTIDEWRPKAIVLSVPPALGLSLGSRQAQERLKDVRADVILAIPLKPSNAENWSPFTLIKDWQQSNKSREFGRIHVASSHVDRDGHLQPIGKIGSDLYLPHASILLGKPPEITVDQLLVNRFVVPINSMLAQFRLISREEVSRLSESKSLMRLMESGGAIVDPGDIIVVMSSLSGALSALPGDLESRSDIALFISALNAGLQGGWIRSMETPFAALFGLGVLGLLVGLFLSPWSFVLAALVISLSTVFVSLVLFENGGVQLPWLFLTLNFLTVAGIAFVERIRLNELRSDHLSRALYGVAGAEQINDFVRAAQGDNLEASGQVVTVVFIDVVGFSLMAETQTPKETFAYLRELLVAVSDIVHEWGGEVNKTLGDGLLCFFGYHFDGRPPDREHADKALHCAIAIQRQNLERNLQTVDGGGPCFPLRIGINTAGVYVGDLGGTRRLDPTLIGNGVNYAKRLESACESYGIMIGPTTRDLLVSRFDDVVIRRKLIFIKHHSEPFEGFEVDVFAERKPDLQEVLAVYMNRLGMEREGVRWPIPDSAPILVHSQLGNGQLKDFSKGGLAIATDSYLSRGIVMNLHLDSQDGILRLSLQNLGIDVLHCEVRWGRADQDHYLHGVEIKNLTGPQQNELIKELRQFLRRSMNQGSLAG